MRLLVLLLGATFAAVHGAEGSWGDPLGKKKKLPFSDGKAKSSVRCLEDEGPWPCHEKGCPSESVNCTQLKPFCKGTFSRVWMHPPESVPYSETVWRHCQMTCGKPVGCSASKGRGSCRMLPCWNKPGFNATAGAPEPSAASTVSGDRAHQAKKQKKAAARSARLQLTSSRERSPTGLPFERSSDDAM